MIPPRVLIFCWNAHPGTLWYADENTLSLTHDYTPIYLEEYHKLCTCFFELFAFTYTYMLLLIKISFGLKSIPLLLS